MIKLAPSKFTLYLLILVGVLFYWYCGRRDETPIGVSKPLPAHVDTQITVGENKVTTRTQSGRTETRYVPSTGRTVIEVSPSGAVTVKTKNKGFTFEPGFSVGLHNSRLAGSLDTKFAYWGRWGAHVGVGGSNGKFDVFGLVGASYGLDRLHLPNTSVMISYTTDDSKYLSLRWRF